MTSSDFPRRPWVIPLLINFGLTAILFAGLRIIPISQLFQCTYPAAQSLSLALALAATLVILFWVFTKSFRASRFLVAGIDAGLILLAMWLGTYSISPLGFSSGRISMVQGFVVMRSMRPDLQVASGGIVNLANGSTSEIRAVTLPVSENCVWNSTNGGTFDSLNSCDIAFIPPANSDLDILRVLIRPSCNLPETSEELRVVVLP